MDAIDSRKMGNEWHEEHDCTAAALREILGNDAGRESQAAPTQQTS